MAKSNEILKDSIKYLKSYKKDSPELDSKILLGFVLGLKHKIYLHDEINVSKKHLAKFLDLIEVRAKGKPISRIIGKRYFWKDVFKINDWTLDPRPESEILIEEILHQNIDKKYNYKILDLGCGSGCLGLSLLREFPNSNLVAIDRCKKALFQAKKNSEDLFFSDRSKFLPGNWFNKNWTIDILNKARIKTKFDIVICNPPYVKADQIQKLQEEVKYFDPIIALDGGNDGCDSYRAIFKNIINIVSNDGLIGIEISDEISKTVEKIILKQGLKIIKILEDYSGKKRVILIK